MVNPLRGRLAYLLRHILLNIQVQEITGKYEACNILLVRLPNGGVHGTGKGENE